MSSFFEIGTLEALFKILDQKFRSYCEEDEKDAEDVLLIVMIVNHLREWIAPGFRRQKNGAWPQAGTPEEEVSREVFEHPNFSIVRAICNGSKHARRSPPMQVGYNENVWTSKNVWNVKDVWKGVPIAHLVDGERIEDVITPIVEMYRNWFSTKPKAGP